MASHQTRPIDKSLLIAAGLLVAVLVVSAAVEYHNTKQLREDAGWVAHTHEVLDLNTQVLLALVDAETGQRGFLITGKEEFLEPYNAALDRFDGLMATLKEKTKDNDRQLDRIQKLEERARLRIALLKEGIDLRRQSEQEARAFLQASKGKQQMDAIRKLLTEIDRDEQALLQARKQKSSYAYRVAIFTGLLNAAIGLAIVGAFVWLLDRSLTARQKAATLLHEQREWLRTTLESIGDAVIATDDQGRITFLNPVAVSLTGWPQDEAKGRSLDEVFRIINEQTRGPVEDPVQKVLAEGKAVGLANHTALIARDGTERSIDDSAAPITGADGTTLGVVLIFRNVSERRQAELERHQLAAIVASSDDAIISKDLNGIVTSWNKSAERIFGYTAAEMIGQPITLLAAHDRLEEMPRILERIKRGERVEPYDTRRRRKDGTEIAISLTVSPIKDSAGRIIGASKIARDVSERMRLQESLKRQAEQLAEADRRKDEFLATLAHELRNPLAPIRNSLQVMRLADNDAHALQQSRDMIERQVQHLVHLVDDLLDVSRITQGKVNLRMERIELRTAVNSALDTSRPLIEECGHELTVHLPKDPVFLDADPTRLAQIIANLLNNAAKYTERGGRIVLSAGREGDEVVVRVQDTGVGIPADMLPLIFDMFTQVDASLHRSQGGLGIGLTLVRRLTELHHGTVQAFSKGRGHGSEFVVRLPAPRSEAQASEKGTPTRDKLDVASAHRILVVDDNQDSANSLSILLRLMGNEVRTVHNGVTALDAARDFLPHVVLLDIGLPGLNGYEVARRLRERFHRDELILVAMTGYGQDEDRRQSREAGFDAHLVKPIDLAALQALLAGPFARSS